MNGSQSPPANVRRLTVSRTQRVVTFTREEPLFEKVCPVCQQAYQGLQRQRYCSNRCLQRASYARNAEKRRAQRRERYQRQRAAQGE